MAPPRRFTIPAPVAGRPFGEYDGLLDDGAAVLAIDAAFGPDYCFSPSQLETYIGLPVPVLQQVRAQAEAASTSATSWTRTTPSGAAGSTTSSRSFEQMSRPGVPPASDWSSADRRDRIEVLAHGHRRRDDRTSGLWEIERGPSERTISRYVVPAQRLRPARASLPTAPHRFELIFGEEDADLSHPRAWPWRGARSTPRADRPDRPGRRLPEGRRSA